MRLAGFPRPPDQYTRCSRTPRPVRQAVRDAIRRDGLQLHALAHLLDLGHQRDDSRRHVLAPFFQTRRLSLKLLHLQLPRAVLIFDSDHEPPPKAVVDLTVREPFDNNGHPLLGRLLAVDLGLPGLHALADVELAELRQDALQQCDLRGTRAVDHRLRHPIGNRFHSFSTFSFQARALASSSWRALI